MDGPRLRDILEEEIAEGRLRPGVRLEEEELARRFGVSRTPIREALKQLAAIGLVTAQPRRGTVVARLTPAELVEMFDVMAELEGMAGRLAARRWNEEDGASLRAAHEACGRAAAAGDADGYYYENERFHEAIYRASHNGFLHRECSALHRRLRPYRRLQLRVGSRMADSYAEHGAVMDALLRRDAATTRALLHDHVVVQGDRFADLIASLPELNAGET